MKIIGCMRIGARPFCPAYWSPIEMEIVDVAPHLASVATFAVCKHRSRYRVTHLETGLAIVASDSPTKRGSIELCARFLKSITIAFVEKRIEHHLKIDRGIAQ